MIRLFNNFRHHYNKKGQAAVLAVAIMIVLGLFSLVGVSIFTAVTTSTRLASIKQRKVKYMARAIMMYYLQKMKEDWSAAISLVEDDNSFDNLEIDDVGDEFFVDVEINYPYREDDQESYQRAEIITRARILSTGIGWQTMGAHLVKPIEYSIRVVVSRLPPAASFALFWGRNPGTALTIANTGIVGDMFARGSVSWGANGYISLARLYYPEGATISGAGCLDCNYVEINNNYPFAGPDIITGVPPFDASVYTDIMEGFDSQMNEYNETIDADVYLNEVSICDLGSSANIHLNGHNYVCKQAPYIFSISGDINITGSGNFISKGTFEISRHAFRTGTVTITPDPGGTIRFLAEDNINIGLGAGTTDKSTVVNPTGTGNVIFYSRSDDLWNEGVYIRNPNTNINNSIILSGNGILVEAQAKINNSDLYSAASGSVSGNSLTLQNLGTEVSNSILLGGRRVEICGGGSCLDCNVFVADNPADRDRNILAIHGPGTSASGSFISLSLTPPGNVGLGWGLAIHSGAVVEGLVYHGGGNASRAHLNNCTVRGSVIASMFSYNSIDNNVRLIYDDEAIAGMLKNTKKGRSQNTSFGFNHVMIEPDSWKEPYFKNLNE